MNVTNIWSDSDGRKGHLLGLMDFSSTENGERKLDKDFAEVTIAAFIAWRDFQERRGDILPHLPSLLANCDFEWTLEIRDSQGSPLVGVQQVLKATEQPRPPFAIAGPFYSRVARTVNPVVGAGLGIPQISGLTTSPSLDGAPLFARTIATDRAEAEAVMTYLQSLHVQRVAVIFMSDDTFGVEFSVDLQQIGEERGISVDFFAIQRGDTEEAILALKEADIRYIVPITTGDWWREMVRLAYQHQVMGHPGYAWFFPGMTDWDDPQFGFARSQEEELAKALHGVGYSHLHLEDNAAFQVALERFVESRSDQAEFLSHLAEPEVFHEYNASVLDVPHLYHYMNYDAVIALGLAACNTSGLFTGEELHQQLLGTRFKGLSGEVSFDPSTGTRSSTSAMYHIKNLVLSEAMSTDSTYHFNPQLAAVVLGSDVQVQNLFVYSDNSTNPPAALPPLRDYDYNLIPVGLQVIGLFLGSAIILVSIALSVWTVWNRKKFIVNAAQPVFLHQLCFGTMAMASATIPMSMQGKTPSPGLDVACMSSLWLLSLGFVLAISAIASKTWRLDMIMTGAEQMSRIKVNAMAVVKPFAVLFTWNVAMLIGWTIVAPSQYVRVEVGNFDTFGRSLESYGTCQSSNGWYGLFSGLIISADLAMIVFAAFKCYKVRNRSAYFAETQSLAWSMAWMTETFILGAPILIASQDNPSAFYGASTALLFVLCVALLAPMFVFKVINQHSRYADARADEKRLRETVKSRDAAPEPNHLGLRVSRTAVSSSMRFSETNPVHTGAMALQSELPLSNASGSRT